MSITKSSLSPARKRLLEMMQRINFGRIENLIIKDGDPVFKILPTIICENTISDQSESAIIISEMKISDLPASADKRKDYILKSKIIKLFNCFDVFKDCLVEKLEVQNGLPFRTILIN